MHGPRKTGKLHTGRRQARIQEQNLTAAEQHQIENSLMTPGEVRLGKGYAETKQKNLMPSVTALMSDNRRHVSFRML